MSYERYTRGVVCLWKQYSGSVVVYTGCSVGLTFLSAVVVGILVVLQK